MTTNSEQSKRKRGRPQIASAERKRHSMTFRVRDDLRVAIEELAKSKGRSLSEQIEYYVEKSVQTEIALACRYDEGIISTVLLKCVSDTDGNSISLGEQKAIDPVSGHRSSERELALSDVGRSSEIGEAGRMVVDVLGGRVDVNGLPQVRQSFRKGRKVVDQNMLLEAQHELALRRTERERNLESELSRALAEISALRASLKASGR